MPTKILTKNPVRYFDTQKDAEEAMGPIDWYIDKNKYSSAKNCFYCGYKVVGFKVETLNNGQVVGWPVCSEHQGR